MQMLGSTARSSVSESLGLQGRTVAFPTSSQVIETHALSTFVIATAAKASGNFLEMQNH